MFSKESTLNVKGIAILLLMFHHLFLNESRVMAYGTDFSFVSYDIIHTMAVLARVCVWIFVFLSAYGLSVQFQKRGSQTVTQYVAKRWFLLMKSFWPMYVVGALIYVVFGKQSIVAGYEGNMLYMLFDFFGWADFFRTPMLASVWWYMCMAQVIVIFVPLIYYACEKLGGSIVPIVFVLLQYIQGGIQSTTGGSYARYLMAVVLGCLLVKYDVLNKLLSRSISGARKVTEGVLIILFIIFLLYSGRMLSGVDKWNLRGVIYAFAAASISYFVAMYLDYKVFNTVFGFLGKYSGNIFMSHTFIYRFIPDLVYWSKEPVLQYLSLLIVSLLIAMLAEWIKGITKYNELEQKLIAIYRRSSKNSL